eukprot:scaffold14911_cov186-Alexandrium_tamarense.AAC.2
MIYFSLVMIGNPSMKWEKRPPASRDFEAMLSINLHIGHTTIAEIAQPKATVPVAIVKLVNMADRKLFQMCLGSRRLVAVSV